MNHKWIKEHLSAFYDGELPEATRREIESHLRTCGECQQASAEWAQIARPLFRTAVPETSETFVHRVLARIAELDSHEQRRDSRVRSHRLRWLIPALGFGALVLASVRSEISRTSLDLLLFSDSNEEMSTQWMLTGQPTSADDVLGLLMEDQR